MSADSFRIFLFVISEQFLVFAEWKALPSNIVFVAWVFLEGCCGGGGGNFKLAIISIEHPFPNEPANGWEARRVPLKVETNDNSICALNLFNLTKQFDCLVTETQIAFDFVSYQIWKQDSYSNLAVERCTFLHVHSSWSGCEENRFGREIFSGIAYCLGENIWKIIIQIAFE